MEFGYIWGDTIPDRERDRIGWNRGWETELQEYYGGLKERSIHPAKASPELQKVIQASTEDLELGLLKETQDLCKLQNDIRKFALPRLASENLEEGWRSLSSQHREELILNVFYKVSSISLDMEESRKICPEMIIEKISKDEGQYFIDLLKTIITDDPCSAEAQVVLLPNPLIDYMLCDPTVKALGSVVTRRTHLSRSYYISFVVWRILLALHNIDEPYYIGKPVIKHDISKAVKKARETGNETFVRTVRNNLKLYKHERPQQVSACWYCEKDPSRLPPGTQLKACTKCKEIGRIIRYCSRECQAADWKKGIPRPHKAICGKPLADSIQDSGGEQPESSTPLMMIPNPDPNFKRSPALIYQISKLKEHQDVDYWIFQSGTLADVGIRLPDEAIWQRIHFLIWRRRAFRSGDKMAVNAMFDTLRSAAEQGGLPVSTIVKQLEKEYEVSVNPDSRTRREQTPAAINTEEFEWVWRYLETPIVDVKC